jgi:hypothetical protein
MKEIDLSTPMGVIFSEDGRYRYVLWRVWSQVKPYLLFVGLNPSKANSTINDPTITRLMVRASTAGYGGLFAANLYSLVSSAPGILWQKEDSIGIDNDRYLQKLIDIAASGRVLCGWGSYPPAKDRAQSVLKMIPDPYCLGQNSDGQPRHPLYVAYSVPMVKLT